MLSTGRRRESAVSTLTYCLGFLLLFACTAHAAVLGIDFGTEHIKAAIVKPGIPLDIVLTKDSKRKEVSALAFKPNRDAKNNIIAEEGSFPERAYGGDALALQGRFPSEVFPNLKLLLGTQSGEESEQTASIYKERYPAVQLEQAQELGTTVVKSSAFTKESLPFSVEELIGMQLANIKRNAEVMAGKGSVVEDAVITVPPFYTANERRAIVKAANYAGLDVTALVSDGLAVGLDYAKTRSFPEVAKGEKPEYHLVYDMGAGSTSATLMRFQSRSVKDVGRSNKTVQEVAVVGAGWQRQLGGDALNHIIMEDFVQKLLTKPALKSRGTTEDDIKKNGRIMSRFFKEAERARQVLSANTETTASFEEIMPDLDLRVKLTRADFERMAAEFADKVETPITDALSMAKLSLDDIGSVILHGGLLRTPFVHEKLEKVVGAAKLRNSVNADESAVFGAAFKAASLSASFKVKEIRASDIASYTAGLTYVDKGKDRKQVLFASSSPVGAGSTTKQVTFKDKEDFTFGFVQNIEGTDHPIVKIQSNNLTATVEELSRKAGCEKETMSTKFGARLSSVDGLPEIISGSVSCEVDDAAKAGSVGDSVKGWLGFGKKKDQESLNGDSEGDGPVEEVDATQSTEPASSSKSATSSAASSSSQAAEPPKKRTETIPLRWTASSQGNSEPASEHTKNIVARLRHFDESDQARTQRDEAQNQLESYTYFVRDFLSNKDYETAGTKDERSLIDKTLGTTREWMESGDLNKATQKILKEKLDALKDLVQPILKRNTERTQRPELIKSLKKTLDDMQKAILRVESDAAKVASSIAKAALSSTSSSNEATGSISDIDDLEEPDTSEAAPKPTQTAEVNPYASIDLEALNDTYKTVSSWLMEKLADQEKLKPHEDPVLLTKDLERKAAEISSSLKELTLRSAAAKKAGIKKPPKPSKSKTAKKAKATADTASDAEEPVPADDIVVDVPTAEQSEGADPEPIGKTDQEEQPLAADSASETANAKQQVMDDESIEDMIKERMQDGKKAKAPEHEEL